jgi:hypothetical protein
VVAAEGDAALLSDASGREVSLIEARPAPPVSKAEAAAAALAAGDWESLTVRALRAELARRGLKKTGAKAALISRLRGHDDGND